jgi:hypothetical protein
MCLAPMAVSFPFLTGALLPPNPHLPIRVAHAHSLANSTLYPSLLQHMHSLGPHLLADPRERVVTFCVFLFQHSSVPSSNIFFKLQLSGLQSATSLVWILFSCVSHLGLFCSLELLNFWLTPLLG